MTAEKLFFLVKIICPTMNYNKIDPNVDSIGTHSGLVH